MASIGDIVAYLRMDSKNFTANARAASTQTKGLNQGLGRMAASAGKGALALAGIGGGLAVMGKAFSGAQGFERALTRSVAIQDVSIEQQDRMRQAALEVSSATKFSATEAAEAFYFLASAGMTAEEQLNAIGTVAQFAQAGNFDMALATDLLTDAQSAMGLSAGDAADKLKNLKLVGDTLVRAETLANASTQQFSEAMTNGAAVAARTYGVSLAETVATLAVFADQGAKGAEAGTKFGIVLRDLTTKSLKQKEAFRAAGVEIFDQTGKFMVVSNAVKELTTLLDGLSDAEKKAELMALGFSDKSVGAIQMLLGTGPQLEAFIETLDNVGGTMERVSDKAITKLDKSMAKLNAQWERFIQNTATPVMENVIAPGAEIMNDAIEGKTRLEQDAKRESRSVLFNPFGMFDSALQENTPGQKKHEKRESMEDIKARMRARLEETRANIERSRRDQVNQTPFGTSLPGLGDVFRSGVKPIGADGASTAVNGKPDPTSAAMLEMLTQQLSELKKLNAETDVL